MKKTIISSTLIAGGLLLIHSGLQSLADPPPLEHPAAIAITTSEESEKDPEIIEMLPPPPEIPEEKLHTHRIRKGDTASRILFGWLSPAQVHELAATCKPVFDMKKLRPGREYRILSTGGTFSRFEYAINNAQFLSVDLDEEGFHADIHAVAYETEVVSLHGLIDTSLSEAMKTPESRMLAVRLANLFGWEIDFLRDLRQGDTFSLLVEKRFHNDTFLEYGDILAAELIVQGKKFDAYRLEHSDGKTDFYTSSGENISRMFLKSPVAFTRISSGFSLRRYHPVLKEYRPHYGVDYAAPVGTPIYAAGDGTLVEASRNASSGRYIRIQHGNGYQTAYLHMSGFARGIRAGKKVRQGDLIGYVGQSGFATGPHVCFRMTKDGVPVDPTGIEAPRATPLPEARRQEFAALVEDLQPRLAVQYARKTTPERQPVQ